MHHLSDNGGSSRIPSLEVGPIDLVIFLEVGTALQEDGGFEYMIHRASSGLQGLLDAAQYQMDLITEASRDLFGFRIHGHLASKKDEVSNLSVDRIRRSRVWDPLH